MQKRVLVVVLMKAGTHLVQELLIELGYRIAGVPRVPAGCAVEPTEADYEQLARFFPQAPRGDLWRLAEAQIQHQLGAPLRRHYGAGPEQVLPGYLPLAMTPAGVAWIVSELDLRRVDGRFWREWLETNEPTVIYVYRDPRATVISMIDFLVDEDGKGYGDYSDFAIFHEVLASIDTPESRLEFALAEDNFPGRHDHARMRWLLKHPRVLSLSYEQLIGARGGGSDESQRAAVEAFCLHLGHSTEVAGQVAPKIYNEQAFTFRAETVDSWRERYTPDALTRANRAYGEILSDYGFDQ